MAGCISGDDQLDVPSRATAACKGGNVMLAKITFCIDPKLIVRLAKAAEFLEMDFNDVLERALSEFLDDLEPGEEVGGGN